MKKRMKYLVMMVLLITVFSAAITASAKNIATAVLEKEKDSNDVTVAIDFSESKTEVITSLRLKILVAVEEAREVAFDGQSVSFAFADIPGVVCDEDVIYDSDMTDYVVDLIVSGKTNLFQNANGGALEIGTLHLPAGDYYAVVGCVIADDGEDNEEDSASELQYVDSAGIQTITARLKTLENVYIGKEDQPETETEKTDPEETEPRPQDPEDSKETEKTPDDLTEPVPSGPITGAETTETEPEQSKQPEKQEKPEESEKTKESEKPELKPAESRKNGLSAPTLIVRPVTGTRKISFAWQNVKGAQGYQIFKYDEKSGKYKKYKNVKGLSYTAKLSYGKTYRFKVRAYKKKDGSKVYGAFSAEKEVTVSSFNKRKAVDFHVTIPKKGKKLRFTWEQVPGAEGYQILCYSEQTKEYEVVKTISDGDTLTCKAVKYGYATDYRFKMCAFAYDDHGNEVFSATGEESTIMIPPARVSKIKVKSPRESTIKVKWEEADGADGYFIYRSGPDEKGKMKKIAKVKGKKKKYIDEGLESGAKYYYQVVAYRRTSEGKKLTAEASNVKSSKVK